MRLPWETDEMVERRVRARALAAGLRYGDPAALAYAAQFEAGYAMASGCTVEDLHAWGRYAEPCACEYPGCSGWAMGNAWEDAIAEDAARQTQVRH